MKKILTLAIIAILCAMSGSAAVRNVYVNPMQNTANANTTIAKRLYKKAILGLTKARTVAVVSGTKVITPGSEEAQAYDYIMTIDLSAATTSEAGTVSNLLGSLSSSKNSNPDWEGKLTTDITLRDAKTGEESFKTTIAPTAVDKDKNVALYNATNNYDYSVTDMTDDSFRTGGEIIDAMEVDKKNIVKKVRIQVGSKDGARKNQAYELYKVTGDNRELIGAAKCEQILSPDESILSISGKKGTDQQISDLIQNNDGSYTIEAWSRSRSGFLHDNFQSIDKMFTNEGRPNYMDPFNRQSKPRIAFLPLEINDDGFSSHKEKFHQKVVEGMSNVPTIELVRSVYPDIESARKDGIDGLVDISIDKVDITSGKTKEGKTRYETHILYTVSGVDVANNKWIDMKSFTGTGSSTDSSDKAHSEALSLMDGRVQKFSEELFPVAALIVSPEEVKKNEIKKVRINIGTDMGVKKGMAFDIYEQRKEGGADSRFLLGEGKAEKDGLTADSAILKVKGKNNGDRKLYELLQNADENTEIVLVSKASYDILEKGLNFLNRGN